MAELRQPDKSIGPTLRTTARNREGHFPYFRAMSMRGVTRWSGIVHRWFGGLVHRSEPLAVSRKPMAHPDALVYESYGLNEDETATVEREM